jgi:hypothetical protein
MYTYIVGAHNGAKFIDIISIDFQIVSLFQRWRQLKWYFKILKFCYLGTIHLPMLLFHLDNKTCVIATWLCFNLCHRLYRYLSQDWFFLFDYKTRFWWGFSSCVVLFYFFFFKIKKRKENLRWKSPPSKPGFVVNRIKKSASVTNSSAKVCWHFRAKEAKLLAHRFIDYENVALVDVLCSISINFIKSWGSTVHPE